jgi:hypothetical protein
MATGRMLIKQIRKELVEKAKGPLKIAIKGILHTDMIYMRIFVPQPEKNIVFNLSGFQECVSAKSLVELSKKLDTIEAADKISLSEGRRPRGSKIPVQGKPAARINLADQLHKIR